MTVSIIQQVMLSRGESHRQMWSLPTEHTAEGRGHITHSSKSHPRSGCSAPSSVKTPFAGYEAQSASQSSLASRHCFHLKHKTRKKPLPFPRRRLYATLDTPHFSSFDIDGQLDNTFKRSGDQPLYPGKLSLIFEGAHSEQVLRSGDSNPRFPPHPYNGGYEAGVPASSTLHFFPKDHKHLYKH